MAILARLGDTPVEVLNTRTEQDGRKLARVQALEGEPFTNWTSGGYATTNTTTVRVEQLSEIHQDPQPKARLIDLAKEIVSSKPQWYVGETVWLVGEGRTGKAFLRNGEGFIFLFVAGVKTSLMVARLIGSTWQPARDLDEKYTAWKYVVQTELERRQRVYGGAR